MDVLVRKVDPLFPLPFHPRQPGRTVTRVANTVIWQGGYARELTRRERLMIWVAHDLSRLPGIQLWPTIKPPTDVAINLQRALAHREERAFIFGEGRR